MHITSEIHRITSGERFSKACRRRAVIIVNKGARGLLALCVMLSFTVVAPAQSAFAAGPSVYYVALNGSDTMGVGSAASPWRTIQKAANTVLGGDTVHVAQGTYTERVTIPSTRSGTAGTTTKFVADGAVVISQGLVVDSSYTDLTGFEVTPGIGGLYYDGGQVQILGSHNTLSGFNVHDTASGCAFTIKSGATYNTVTDFVIKDPGLAGFWFDQGDTATRYNTLSNGQITGWTSMQAVSVHGTGNVCDGLLIHDHHAVGGNDGDGIRPHGIDLVIRNCRIYNIFQTNIGAHSDCIQFWDHNTNLLIENNVLSSWNLGGTAGGMPDGLGEDGTAIMMAATAANSDWTIRNNLFLGSGINPIQINTTGSFSKTLRLHNNTFWTRGFPQFSGITNVVSRNNIYKNGDPKYQTRMSWTASAGISQDYCLFESSGRKPVIEGVHSIVGDPKFINPDVSATTGYGNADYRLLSTSAAIGGGDPADAPVNDITGASRVAIPDIGAYEYLGSPPPNDTTAPTVSITAPTAGSTVSGSVAIAATAADNVGVASVEFRADGTLVGTDATAPYASTWNASAASVGSHTLTARALDAAGNAATSTVAVNVPAPPDTTSPGAVTLLTAARTGSATLYWTNPTDPDFSGVRMLRSTVGFAVSANDLVGQLNIYEGNAATYHDTTAPDSAVYYTVFARDLTGNWSLKNTVSLPVVVSPDTTQPITTPTVDRAAGSSGWYQSVPSVNLSVDETATTFYQWDTTGGVWSVYTGPIATQQGTHTLYFNSMDAAGNVELASRITLQVDSGSPTAPTAASFTHPESGVPNNSANASFSFAANDGVSGVSGYSYTFDQSAATVPDAVLEGAGTSVSFPVASDGIWFLHVRAVDAAGNWGSTTHVGITSDRTAPPSPVLTATSSASAISLTWTPATDSRTTRVLRSTTSYPSSPIDPSATLVHDGVGAAYSDTAVASGTTYYYSAFAQDAAGNWSSAGQVTAVVTSPTTNRPVLNLVASATTLTWNKYLTLSGQYLIDGVVRPSPVAVTVWSNASGVWKQIGLAKYNTTSKTYTYTMRMTKSASFEIRCEADALNSSAVSNRVAVSVKRYVAMTTAAPAVRYGSTARTSLAVSAPAPTTTKIIRSWYNSRTHRWTLSKVIVPRVTSANVGFARLLSSVHLPRRGKWRLVGVNTSNGITTTSKTVYVMVR